ncbi:MAG: cob(I)yrinic acid a,c-diamide adenosyltransferase [Akkermansiaceae bacterium]|nr:cob(I)yrinic acid a,c-diamide adenosyltransferase [Akkermansiaceae bacterium]
MSIITGRGDSGESDLLFGKRIAKGSVRLEALGDVDELNAALGVARAEAGEGEWSDLIDAIQQKLVGLMGQLATLPEDEARYAEKGYATISDEDVQWITDKAKAFEAAGIRFEGWARPGEEGCSARAHIDLARSIARRAERSVWRLHQGGEVVPQALRLFLNRLSDLLWILARVEPDG